MRPTKNPRVKICCISSREEADLAIQCGASALGLVSHMPSGPGIIKDDLIKEITAVIPPPISTFLLTSKTDSTSIINHYQKVNTSAIQIVDALAHDEYARIRKALPGVKLVQVIHVMDENAVSEALMVEKYIDAILLDSGNPNLKVKELGGTGSTHNWELSREIRERVEKPVFLAGGINADNVRMAIDQVQPFGIDLCSGVRTERKLDKRKLVRFFEAIS